MRREFKVAVVGATGLVGREIINILEERHFPVASLLPLASSRSAGEKITFNGKELSVQEAKPTSFEGMDLVLMSAGGQTSADLAPHAAKAGAIVIDNSSQWRMDPHVPLVVPEINAADAALCKAPQGKGIIANPNCSTIQMVVALAPLHQQAKALRLVVSTYQAVSGKGKQGVDELGDQVADLFNNRDIVPKAFARRIAFNCIPQIDVFLDDAYTKEERKMRDETRKILHAPEMGICATCVRVPVFNSHAVSVVAEFAEPLTADAARDLLRGAPGVLLVDDPSKGEFPTHIDTDGQDATFVGRIRQDPSGRNALALWCVADNLRKGAATNAVQIAEVVGRDLF